MRCHNEWSSIYRWMDDILEGIIFLVELASINIFRSLLGEAHSATLPIIWNPVGALLTTRFVFFFAPSHLAWDSNSQPISSDSILNLIN